MQFVTDKSLTAMVMQYIRQDIQTHASFIDLKYGLSEICKY